MAVGQSLPSIIIAQCKGNGECQLLLNLEEEDLRIYVQLPEGCDLGPTEWLHGIRRYTVQYLLPPAWYLLLSGFQNQLCYGKIYSMAAPRGGQWILHAWGIRVNVNIPVPSFLHWGQTPHTCLTHLTSFKPCWNLFSPCLLYPQEPWPSLPPLLLWALLLPEGSLRQRWSLSVGCPSAGTAGSQETCQSSPTGGSSQLCKGPVQRPAAVLPVNAHGLGILYWAQSSTCVTCIYIK